MNYTAWVNAHLEQVRIGDKSQTSVWQTEASDLPLLVLVHGISGDHAGLVPFALELSKNFRIAIVELPGHGDSEPIPLPNAAALQDWFTETVRLLEADMGKVAVICAHSFGCSAVLSKQLLRDKDIILINPVPTPSYMYASYSRIIMTSAHFWAHIYNWPLFVLMRGAVLRKLHTREAKQRVRWTALHSQPTYQQVVFQAGLVNMILDGSAYHHAKVGNVKLVICAMFDTTAAERDSLDMEAVFGASKTVFLNGGHLLPIESPARVARVVTEVMIH